MIVSVCMREHVSVCDGDGSPATCFSVLCWGAPWSRWVGPALGTPPTVTAPCPVVGGCQSLVSLRTPGPELASPPPWYPREAEANRRGCGVTLGRQGGGGRPKLAWRVWGHPPGLWVGWWGASLPLQSLWQGGPG